MPAVLLQYRHRITDCWLVLSSYQNCKEYGEARYSKRPQLFLGVTEGINEDPQVIEPPYLERCEGEVLLIT
jgi:hypothetical protein